MQPCKTDKSYLRSLASAVSGHLMGSHLVSVRGSLLHRTPGHNTSMLAWGSHLVSAQEPNEGVRRFHPCGVVVVKSRACTYSQAGGNTIQSIGLARRQKAFSPAFSLTCSDDFAQAASSQHASLMPGQPIRSPVIIVVLKICSFSKGLSTLSGTSSYAEPPTTAQQHGAFGKSTAKPKPKCMQVQKPLKLRS